RIARTAAFGVVVVGLALVAATSGASVVKPTEEAMKSAGSSFDFAGWDRLLAKYVDDLGRVDYAALKANAADVQALERLYAQVAAQKIEALVSREAQEAFLLDAYNVAVWKNVLARLPGLKDLDGKLKQYDFFYSTDFIVGGTQINLKKLEDDGVRERFHDPR